jgi:hypothetical protein
MDKNMFLKYGNKNSKNLGTKVKTNPRTKSRNKNYQNPRTKITKIWE